MIEIWTKVLIVGFNSKFNYILERLTYNFLFRYLKLFLPKLDDQIVVFS